MAFDSILALDGRVTRRRYLAFLTGAYFAYWALEALAGFAWVSFSERARIEVPELAKLPHLPRPVGIGLTAVGTAAAVVLFFVSVSFAVRRFHDMNLPGNWNWLVVLVAVVPVPGLSTPGFPYPPAPQTAFLVWHAFLLLYPGTTGRNRFGPAPGEPAVDDLIAVFDDDRKSHYPSSRPSR